MLGQLLVLSPSGICYIHRSYDGDQGVDPHIISAMAAVESSGGAKLSDITKILRQEFNNNNDLNVDIVRTHNYVSCAISTTLPMRQKLQKLLPKVNQMVYETMGNPNNKFTMEKRIINQVENKIDLLMIRSGLISS